MYSHHLIFISSPVTLGRKYDIFFSASTTNSFLSKIHELLYPYDVVYLSLSCHVEFHSVHHHTQYIIIFSIHHHSVFLNISSLFEPLNSSSSSCFSCIVLIPTQFFQTVTLIHSNHHYPLVSHLLY
jgi:hypothetical protein